MEQHSNNNKMVGIVVAVVVALLALGVWVWAMNDSETEDTTQEPTDSQQAEQTQDDAAQQNQQDIVDTAVATESLSTLVTAAQAADLVDTLKGEGPFTVFAPTNAAFEKLPEGTLDNLLLEENKEQLASLLQYHVVSGKVMSGDLENGQTIATLNGENLTVEITDGMVYLVDATGAKAQVTTADVETSNGVVHIIDSVVMPE